MGSGIVTKLPDLFLAEGFGLWAYVSGLQIQQVDSTCEFDLYV
jgi:hypothetical protein